MLLTQTLYMPVLLVVWPAETWICMSYGVPAEPTALLHWVLVAHDGQLASLKQIGPDHPLVKAAIETNGATLFELSAFWVKPMRTSLPPLEPVSVIMKHETGPVYWLLTGLVPPESSSSTPIPQPHLALVESTTVVPLMQHEPVVQMFEGCGLAHDEPSV
jgi:hypothetical protein